MQYTNNLRWVKLTLVGVLISVLGCGLFPNPNPETIPMKTATPTSTPKPGNAPVTAVTTNRCETTWGSLEMQVLAGPAAAVGMEPHAVGNIPYSIVTDGQEYIVQGGGDLSYQKTLEETWGTYTVSLDMTTNISGECSGELGSEMLSMTVKASGEQMVEIRADGFSGNYPWSGTHTLNLTFPLEEGASAEGEGWAFILHLIE